MDKESYYMDLKDKVRQTLRKLFKVGSEIGLADDSINTDVEEILEDLEVEE